MSWLNWCREQRIYIIAYFVYHSCALSSIHMVEHLIGNCSQFQVENYSLELNDCCYWWFATYNLLLPLQNMNPSQPFRSYFERRYLSKRSSIRHSSLWFPRKIHHQSAARLHFSAEMKIFNLNVRHKKNLSSSSDGISSTDEIFSIDIFYMNIFLL